MSSPRMLRPHTIIVRNYGPEVDGQETHTDTVLRHVKFDGSYGIALGKRGVQTTDRALIIVDCNDYEADKKLVCERDYKDSNTEFCFRNNDVILYNDQEFTITSVKETNPFRDYPEFIEVTCE